MKLAAAVNKRLACGEVEIPENVDEGGDNPAYVIALALEELNFVKNGL